MKKAMVSPISELAKHCAESAQLLIALGADSPLNGREE